MDKALIRNFCIIAHIDHGKSTLADRIWEFVGEVDRRTFHDQLLDDMELERERGIPLRPPPSGSNTRQKMARPIVSI